MVRVDFGCWVNSLTTIARSPSHARWWYLQRTLTRMASQYDSLGLHIHIDRGLLDFGGHGGDESLPSPNAYRTMLSGSKQWRRLLARILPKHVPTLATHRSTRHFLFMHVLHYRPRRSSIEPNACPFTFPINIALANRYFGCMHRNLRSARNLVMKAGWDPIKNGDQIVHQWTFHQLENLS